MLYIPLSVAIGERLQLPHGGFGVCIHDDTIIGDDAIIHHNVTIGNGGARIGDRVYLGAGALILGAVEIGDDVVIGAGAIVTFDVPSGSYVAAPKGRLFKDATQVSQRREGEGPGPARPSDADPVVNTCWRRHPEGV